MTLARYALDDLLAPTTVADRLARLRSEGLADETGLTFVLDRVEELVHESPKAADELAALVEAAAVQHPNLLARSRYLRARVLAERGELDAALRLIEQARAGWWSAGRLLPALRTDLGRMQVLDDLGRHREAATVGVELLAALEGAPLAPGEDPALRRWLSAATWDNIGVATGFLGEHERAISAFERSEEVYRSLGMSDEVARPMANRGVELLRLGRAREARAVLGVAAEAFAAAGDRLWSAKCLAYLAQAHQQLGELVQALRALESTRVTMDELGADAEAARTRLAIAAAYLEVGLAAEARAEAEAAAEITTAAGMRRDTAAARFTVALADLAEGRLEAAAAALAEAAALFERSGARAELARVALAEAEVALAGGRRAEAERRAAAAAEELAAGGWLVPLAEARLRQADIAAERAAEMAVGRHLAAAAEVLEQVGSPHLWSGYRLRLARLHRRQGRVDAAEALLRRAVDDVERLGGTLPGRTLRAAFRAENVAAHDELVELLVGRGSAADVAAADRISCRAKARTLVDLVSGTIGRTDGGRDARIDTVERADLDAVYGTLLTVTDPATRVRLRTRAAELEQELTSARLRREITQAPDPAADRTAPAAGSSPVPRLSYHVCGADLVAFVGQGDRLASMTIPGVMQAVETELVALTAQWSRFTIGPAFARRHEAALLAAVRTVLRSLHRLVLEPVLPLVESMTGGGTDALVIVPHRRLHQVPFHALYDGAAHVVERWAVTIAPSDRAAAPAPVATAPAAVFAVPDAQAPLVAAEAEALAAVLPGAEVVLGADATWDALRAAVPGPSLVHIACHGLYRPGNPLFSALRLADRWVTSAEVLELDLRGSLVTLSACESGRHGGDAAEPVGLAWAFLAAGAAGAVVSQWVAHDAATTHLMSAFYRHLAAGQPPAHALRAAQLATAQQWPHPFYWAPFSHVASPVREGSSP